MVCLTICVRVCVRHQVLHALGRQLTVAPLRAAIADRSLLGFINALLGTEVWEAVFGSAAGAAGPQARGAVATAARRAAAARAARAAAASAAADTNTTTHTTGTPTHTATVSTASTAVPVDSMDRTATRHNNVPSAVSTSSVSVPSAVSVSVSGVSQVDSSSASVGVGEGWCGEHLASFKSNIAKHAEEISKMQVRELSRHTHTHTHSTYSIRQFSALQHSSSLLWSGW